MLHACALFYFWRRGSNEKILSITLLLLILLVSTPFSELNLNVQAAEPLRTQQEAKDWIINAEGEFWDWDKQHGAQCVDLIYYYYNYLGVSPRGGNANILLKTLKTKKEYITNHNTIRA